MKATQFTDETWLPVVGLEDRYEVSDQGKVWSLHADRLMSIQTGNRYPKVMFKVNGKQRFTYVHRLMAAAFIGPCPDGMEVCHNNGDAFDNRIENLRYDTHAANQQDMVRHGHHIYGRRTRCGNGHEYTPENTRVTPTKRLCRSCERDRGIRRRRAAKEAA